MRLLRWLFGRADPEARERLTVAVAAIDRELAANLELTSMFDQTHHAVVLENGEFARHRATIEHELPSSFAALADLYGRMPEAESAMERRGPAASLREEDRAIVERWEGDARALQRALRDSLSETPRSLFAKLVGRLRGKPASVR